MNVNRRDFLKLSGVAATVPLIPNAVNLSLHAVEEDKSEKLNGKIVNTACGMYGTVWYEGLR